MDGRSCCITLRDIQHITELTDGVIVSLYSGVSQKKLFAIDADKLQRTELTFDIV